MLNFGAWLLIGLEAPHCANWQGDTAYPMRPYEWRFGATVRFHHD